MLCRAQQEGAPPATLAYESSSEQRTQATEPNLQFELPRSVSQEDHKQSSGIRLSLFSPLVELLSLPLVSSMLSLTKTTF